MRTTDPSVAAQSIFETLSRAKVQNVQHLGVYIATVTDTHSNNSTIPQGTLAFSVPHINATAGWVPAPFPGTTDPPIGTECVVAFEGTTGNAPRVIAFTDWHPGQIITVSDTAPTGNNVGDLWIQP